MAQSIQGLIPLFKNIPAIKLVYFFGSQANKTAGPLSDYDFAFYTDGLSKQERFDLKLDLINKLSRFFKTDKIDIVILNDIEQPELKYNIITEGKLIYEVEPFKVLIEPKFLNEYFDFRDSLRRHNLTKA